MVVLKMPIFKGAESITQLCIFGLPSQAPSNGTVVDSFSWLQSRVGEFPPLCV